MAQDSKTKAVKSLRGIPLLTSCLAEVFNVSKQTIANWVCSENCPQISTGKFDLAAVIAWHTDRLKKAAREAAPKSQRAKNKESDWLEAYRREKALTAKLERLRVKGKLVDFEEILTLNAAAFATVRQKILSWKTRLPALLDGKTPAENAELLDAEIYGLLERLQSALTAKPRDKNRLGNNKPKARKPKKTIKKRKAVVR